jgi:hypothetical protein
VTIGLLFFANCLPTSFLILNQVSLGMGNWVVSVFEPFNVQYNLGYSCIDKGLSGFLF